MSRRKAQEALARLAEASSWSQRTGVRPTVTGWPRSTSSSGRYTLAIASHSHSSPKGHVPKPST